MVSTNQLISRVQVLEVRGELPGGVTDLVYDSRDVGDGSCFLALRGTRTDGHRFLDQARKAGAVLAIVEEIPEHLLLPCIRVPDTLAAAPLLAADFYGHPARELVLAGFTGTNGKTSSTYLLESVWSAAGIDAAVLGTIQYRWRNHQRKATNTTPLALDLHRLFDGIRREGVHHVAMEVSSHSLRLHRVDGLSFDAACFTNLSPEHLDFHRDLEDYGAAKAVLFEQHLSASGVGVINTDDPFGKRLFSSLPSDRRMSFGFGAEVDVTAEDTEYSSASTSFLLKTPEWCRQIRSSLVGEHNLRNMLGTTGMAIALGISEDAIVRGLGTDGVIPGRLEPIENSLGARIFVDFAHTPDGLFQVLNSLGRLPHRKLVTVFGCGGDRDQTKRPVMGSIAQTHSDLAIVTSDNPRTENPRQILDGVVAGMSEGGGAFEVVADRRTAIARALEVVGDGDILLVAGKGHETTQILGTQTHYFDDREVVREFLANIERGGGNSLPDQVRE